MIYISVDHYENKWKMMIINYLYTNTLDSFTLKNYSWDLASFQYTIVVQTEVQAGVTKNDKWIDNVYFFLQANHFKYLNL